MPKYIKSHPHTASQSKSGANDIQARFQAGLDLHQSGKVHQAREIYRAILGILPNHFGSLHYLGVICYQLGDNDTAFNLISQAIRINPNVASAHANLGLVLQKLNRSNDALTSYEKALALNPDSAEVYNNRSSALNELKRPTDALRSCDQALRLNPRYGDAHINRGNALVGLKRFTEAVSAYTKALEILPNREFLLGTLLHNKMRICDWTDLSSSLSRLEENISRGIRASNPFPVLGLTDNPEIQRQAARIFVNARYAQITPKPLPFKQGANQKIRIGYYSADFRAHAVSYLIADLIKTHNRDKFEVIGFSFSPRTNDATQLRILSHFDKIYDITPLSDKNAAMLSRKAGIDIAIDLGGHTQHARSGLFAERCAPVQVNYLGFPGTLGASYIDYIIADKVVIPTTDQKFFSEKIVYLPHSFHACDSSRVISSRIFSRQELKLPESDFVFCCFNNSYKITPATFESWMKILCAVNGSVLWLYADDPETIGNLKREAKLRGVNGERLIFASTMAYDDHLVRYHMADLFLDTLPYNAGTTASDALWVGLPVLTCMGASFASRMAASLLIALDLPELVTRSASDYECAAIELARNAQKLKSVKMKLDRNRTTTPLFDGTRFARDIESAYETMHTRQLQGLLPDHIYVRG